MNKKFKKSQSFLEKAVKVIPLASQTFSKSFVQYPIGVSPHFVKKAKGTYLWDIDNNKYLDLVNGLHCISLGYSYSSVDNAVKNQMKNGNTFSLPHELEFKVASKLTKLIPSCDMVRFGKNGTDCTSAAIRIARAFTNKDVILSCGYHGWQDWSIATTNKNLGIPKEVVNLTISFPYNNLNYLNDLIKKFKNKIAAVVMEPMNKEYPIGNYLKDVKKLCKKNNILLIFDETITGFRFSEGGAQELFKVTPDISTFGKGLANGYPLSAIVGKRRIMKYMDKIFFSGTFGGETLSLAAADKVIDIIKNKPVIKKIYKNGDYLIKEINKLIESFSLNEFISITGHPSWSFLNFKKNNRYDENLIKTFYLQEIFKRNLLCIGTHNLNYSFNKSDADFTIKIYEEVFSNLKKNIIEKKLYYNLKTKKISPIFKTR